MKRIKFVYSKQEHKIEERGKTRSEDKKQDALRAYVWQQWNGLKLSVEN